MLRLHSLVAAIVALMLLTACGGGGDGGDEAGQAEVEPLETLTAGAQQASYALGVDLGRQVAGMPGADEQGQVVQGLHDQMAGDARLDFQAAREIMAVQPHDHGEGEADHEHEDTWTARGFASETAQRSYAIGVTLAQFAEMQLADIDEQALTQGLTDRLEEKELLVDETATREIIVQYQEEVRETQAADNLAEGNEFLEENAERPAVTTTESGLQYEVLREGDGSQHPTPTDTVEVHYHGTLLDGTVFDSSVERGEPVEFPLNRVIPGWIEGVQLMTPGAKYKFFIPAGLAYGERGAGAKIGPNATLVFEVELLSIK
jgi:FKBP-type peptidyl-prolyl cis-trans isomerase